ncbi:MAG: DUF1152 domain-containing protein [Deltaproteobacteria bacterium]|nr:DUF1152 domain-containing protein [Deltaproteobacteria bacterium]MBI2534844.1 DUF1152 domain-containing protein [Deltaproteobacteria bacterium]MBI3067316.1 DUF1152 domain-containing protein [Deltaproteobacteria bacterium]
MTPGSQSLEDLIRASSRALVIGVGGGGDVVGALAAARFLEFCGLEFVLGGLSWERSVYDPIPGPRKLSEVRNVRDLHEYAWMANGNSQTTTGVPFAESKMAAVQGQEVLLIDINGGVKGAVDGLEVAMKELSTDLLVGLDVGGDSLAQGDEPGLRSPLADSIMLAAFAEMEKLGHRTLWGVFGYGSDGELTVDEIESALSKLAGAGGLLGGWSLTPKVAAELEEVVKTVPTEASAVPVRCFRGAWGESKIRSGQRSVKLTPLTALTFFMSATKLYETLSRPAQAVRGSASLENANDALRAIGVSTELDFERNKYQRSMES